MKIEQLTKNKVAFTNDNGKRFYFEEDIAGAIRWLRLEIDNLYRKFNKGDVWRWSNDEVCDNCAEYVMKKIDEAFPDIPTLPKAKETNKG
ncbi:MAG: hypothetical protein ACTSX6_04650 [Candidatus Heimdallarchaeaceae archaeon]